jgi:hypothetical protein
VVHVVERGVFPRVCDEISEVLRWEREIQLRIYSDARHPFVRVACVYVGMRFSGSTTGWNPMVCSTQHRSSANSAADYISLLTGMFFVSQYFMIISAS